MTDRPSVRPEAEMELLAAAEWYKSKRRGLGIELMMEADETLNRIQEAPEAHPLWRKGRLYRKRSLRRFPFIVFFRCLESGVEVIAFAHAKRKPGYWVKRLSG